MIYKGNLSPEHSRLVLTEMCKRVGVDAETFDFKQPDWYTKKTWTEVEQEDFQVWLGKFLTKHKYTRGKYRGQDHCYYEAGKLIFNYGWKTI